MPELEAFFHDLRALRASGDLSLAELAGLAHFPEEALAAAETGPAGPPNPVLVAYVQACGGRVGQGEGRWRPPRPPAGAPLKPPSPLVPGKPLRRAGARGGGPRSRRWPSRWPRRGRASHRRALPLTHTPGRGRVPHRVSPGTHHGNGSVPPIQPPLPRR